MKDHRYVAIMAGGIGSRFWPKSRTAYPKQFLDILGTGKTLLQSTFDRFGTFIPAENIYIVTSAEYVDIVEEQVPDIPRKNILAEPRRMNTAPCIAYISFKLMAKDPEACLMVAPSDHLVGDVDRFRLSCIQACDFTEKNNAIVTLGIKPSHPNTGYGYINFDPVPLSWNIHPVRSFTEKPDLAKARTFVEGGQHLWNAGLFIFRVKEMIAALGQHMPCMQALFLKEFENFNTPYEAAAILRIYGRCESISIDFGVMEKAANVCVIPSDFQWSDLGTWNSAYENLKKDKGRNALLGDNIIIVGAKGCMVHAPKKKLVLMEGVEDLIVVDTDDALLICRKENEQQIKEYVAEIKLSKGNSFL